MDVWVICFFPGGVEEECEFVGGMEVLWMMLWMVLA